MKKLRAQVRRLRKQIQAAAVAEDLDLVEDLVAELDQAIDQIHIQQARDDPNAFIEYVFSDKHGDPLRQSKFHRDWQSLIAHPEWNPNGYRRGMIIAPRDHGKTTQIPVGRVLWELGKNPNLRIKIACQSDSKAMERLFEITDHMERNEKVAKVFPHLRPAQRGDWTKHKIVVQRTLFSKDASIEALGIMSTATGGRCDLLIADDIVDRRNAIQFPQIRETIKHAWKSDWTNLLEPDGRVVYICTLWHTADLSHELMKNPAFAVLAHAVDSELDHLDAWASQPGDKRQKREWREPLWHHWDHDALLARKIEIGTIEFDRAFRNIALSGEIVVVQPKWIRYFESLPPAERLVFFQGFDLAIGKKSQHDYFATVTVAIDIEELVLYVVEFWRARLSFTQQAMAIINAFLKWEPEQQRIESIAYQESLPQYLDELVGKQIDENGQLVAPGSSASGIQFVPPLPLVRVKPQLDKMARLKAATPFMERGQILFDPFMNPESDLFVAGNGDLVAEITEFPLAAKDDLADAFVHAVNGAARWLAQKYSEAREDDVVDCQVTIVGT